MNPTPAKLIRRTHMYLALFLTPWMVIYALSGLVLNHQETVRGWYGGKFNDFEKIEERPYAAAFSADADARMIGGQVLADLGLAGAFNVQGTPNQPKLVITRNAAFTAHRVTYFRTENRLLIEKLALNAPMTVNRLHFRHGYEQPFIPAKIWGFMVDLAIVGLLFWIVSGIWMWWEIKPARTTGAIFVLIGFGAFSLLLATI
ncbi:MAG: hypothetical protein RL077_521 [Verrucomicrobiota bacterium]|jgi:hypothetical protein